MKIICSKCKIPMIVRSSSTPPFANIPFNPYLVFQCTDCGEVKVIRWTDVEVI